VRLHHLHNWPPVQQISRAFSRFLVPLSTVLLLARCGGTDLTLPGDTGASKIELVDGNNQNGAAGEPLGDSLVVLVTDRRGAPVAGQQVAFEVLTDAPGSQVKPDVAETSSQGKAKAQWTLGTVSGTQKVVARVVGADGLEVSFNAVVGSGGAVRIEPVSGDEQTGRVGTALDDSLVVRVLDQFGNPVAGVEVDWDADRGSVDPASVTTGADGRAATLRTLGSSTGDQTATAQSSGLDGSPVTFTSHAAAGSASRLLRVSGDRQTGAPGAQLSDPLVVRLVDAQGNGVPDHPVSWVVGAGGGQVDSPNSNTSANGEASTHWTLGSARDNTVNAVVSGVGVITFTATAGGAGGGGGGGGGGGEGGSENPPVPTRLDFQVQPSNTKSDNDISPAVEVAVLDQNGNRVTGQSIEVKLDLTGSKDGKLEGHLKKRTDAGVATFDDLRVKEPGEYELRASADGLPSVVSAQFQIEEENHEGHH
jgi:hypothetical protein